MPAHAANFYAQWRARAVTGVVLREDEHSAPPEFLLQAAWHQQRLRRDELKTLDGQAVRVLHPGFRNHEPGPDFRGAVVQIGGEPARTGDVEIDLRANGWRAHGHDRNPAFKRVVLHVIWEGERAAASIPTLTLSGRLDAPVDELSLWLGRDSLADLPEDLRGKCCAPLRELEKSKLVELLHQAARARWEAKAAQFQARARQAGWEQALWEGIFRALGYKHNVWPMQCLVESRARWQTEKIDARTCQARLFGISGLLPTDLTRASAGADSHLRHMWDQWWREREQFDDCVLPRGLWHFGGLRPANHPQRRIALAAHWLASNKFLPQLERWFTTTLPDAALPDSLLEILQIERDDFWSWHWTFRSARLPKPQPLIGAARATDVAVNVILPWFWMRAAEGKSESLQRVAEHRYFNWPVAEDNSALKLARQRLLGGAKLNVLPNAAAQQGLLQILRDFCDHSNALCDNCTFPELVRDFAKQ